MDNPFAPSPRKSPSAAPAKKSAEPAAEKGSDDSPPPADPSAPIPVEKSEEAPPLPVAEVPAVSEEKEETEPISEAVTEVEVSQEPTAPIGEAAPESGSEDEPPPLDLEEVSCRSCRFFHIPEGHTRMDVLIGECRCKAPMPGMDSKATWPSVDWGAWCGEWDQGISDDDMVRLARNVAESMSE